MLARNGYPLSFVDNCIKEFFNIKFEHNPKVQAETKERPYKYIIFHLPYLGLVSMHLQNEIKFL